MFFHTFFKNSNIFYIGYNTIFMHQRCDNSHRTHSPGAFDFLRFYTRTTSGVIRVAMSNSKFDNSNLFTIKNSASPTNKSFIRYDKYLFTDNLDNIKFIAPEIAKLFPTAKRKIVDISGDNKLARYPVNRYIIYTVITKLCRTVSQFAYSRKGFLV